MIANQTKGTSFRGLLNYLHKEDSLIIGGNMVGVSARELSTEFALSRQLNPDLERAVYHASLSLPKTEGLDNDTWNEVAFDYLKGMGFDDSQYVIYRHHDKEHDHIHLVASRIRLTDGKTVSDSWDYVRSEKLVRELEQKYELTPTISSKQKLERGQTTGEIKLIERTGEESVRAKLQQAIDAETLNPTTMPELINQLKNKGIDARVSITRTKKIRGISYQLDGVAFSGTHLGKGYTWTGLQKHKQVSYDQALDRIELIKASEREPGIKTTEQREAERSKQIEQATSQQRERSLIIAPILKDYINEVGLAEIESRDYRIDWQKEKQTLYLYLKNEAEPRLEIKYQNLKFELIESVSGQSNKPILTDADVSYWQQFAIRLHDHQEQKRRQQQIEQQKKQNRGRGFSR